MVCRVCRGLVVTDGHLVSVSLNSWKEDLLQSQPSNVSRTETHRSRSEAAAVLTDLRVFSSEADVVHPGVLCAEVLGDVDGEVVNVGETSDPAGKHGRRNSSNQHKVTSKSTNRKQTIEFSKKHGRLFISNMSGGTRQKSKVELKEKLINYSIFSFLFRFLNE